MAIGRILRATIHSFLVALAGLLMTSAATAVVLNVGGTYHEYKAGSCSATGFTCIATFTALPAGKSLVIEHVNCTWETTDTPNPPLTLVSDTAGFGGAEYFVPQFQAGRSLGGKFHRTYTLNAQSGYIVYNARTPQIRSNPFQGVGTLLSMKCSIDGQLK